MISEAVIGALFGGMLRLVPELLKYLDRRDERRHEKAMQQMEVDLTAKMWGKERPAVAPLFASGAVDALRALQLDRQIDRAGKRFPFVDVVSALVRPSTTWALLMLYVGMRLFAVAVGKDAYGSTDLELLSTVLSYWFVSRTYERSGAKR